MKRLTTIGRIIKQFVFNTSTHYVIDTHPNANHRPHVMRSGQRVLKADYRHFKDYASTLVPARDNGVTKAPYIVLVENVIKKPVKPSNAFPKGDVDNYSKGVLDSITDSKNQWLDDNQVIALVVTKRYVRGDESPHVKVWIKEMTEDMEAE